MDNFIDKLAQKSNAQEMIKANSQAETEEMERLQTQVSEYEEILQEMRKLNYRNAELAEKLDKMVGDNADIIRGNADMLRGMKEDEQQLIASLRDLVDEQMRNREAELARKEQERVEQERMAESQKETDLTAITELLEDKFQKSEDFVHKENVKSYRNVQAVIVDEIKNCIDSMQKGRVVLKNQLIDEMKKEMDEKLERKLNRRLNQVMTFDVISVVVSVVSVVLWVLLAMGIF